MKLCQHCSKEIPAERCGRNYSYVKYCSLKCNANAWALKRSKGGKCIVKDGKHFQKTCVVCGNEFKAIIFNLRAKTCSSRCSSRNDYLSHRKARTLKIYEWISKNPDRRRAYQRGHYARHRDIMLTKKKARQAAKLTLPQWTAICASQGYLCAWCKKQFDLVMLSVDHIQPVTKGGSNERGNLQAMCFPCNRRKGNRIMDPSSFDLSHELSKKTL